MKEYFLVNNHVNSIQIENERLINAARLDASKPKERHPVFLTKDDAVARVRFLKGQSDKQYPIFIVKAHGNAGTKGTLSICEVNEANEVIGAKPVDIKNIKTENLKISGILLNHIDMNVADIDLGIDIKEEELGEVDSEDLDIAGLYEKHELNSSKEEGELSSEEERPEFSAEDEEQELSSDEEQELSSDEEQEEVQEEVQALSATEKAEQVAKKSALDRIRPYVPSAKTVVKNGLPLFVTFYGLYLGNDALLSQAAQYSIPLQQGLTASAQYLPEAVAASKTLLPTALGLGTRVAVEVPEVSASLFSKAWSGLKSVTKKATDTLTGFKERWKERRAKAAELKASQSQSRQTAKERLQSNEGESLQDRLAQLTSTDGSSSAIVINQTTTLTTLHDHSKSSSDPTLNSTGSLIPGTKTKKDRSKRLH